MIKFEKVYTRDTTIIMQELWGWSCTAGVRERFGIDNPHRPAIIHYMNDGSIEIWENQVATQYLTDTVLAKNQQDAGFLPALLKEYNYKLAELKTYWQKGSLDDLQDFNTYLEKVKAAMVEFVFCYYSTINDHTPEAIRQLGIEFRNEDTFFASNDAFIRSTLVQHYLTLRGFETAVFSNEVMNPPAMAELEIRRAHLTLIDGAEKTVETLEQLQARRSEFKFSQEKVEPEQTELRGQVAFKGVVQGPVRILRRRDQTAEVKEGDIIVSPMTTPDFLPAMQKAAAIVTDEGGITCHAAIVARELKKPCIIGTKIATKVLKDGDMVEVDADNGIVKRL